MSRKVIGFRYNILFGNAAIPAAHTGDYAVSAMLAAALRDLQIREMPSGSKYSFPLNLRKPVQIAKDSILDIRLDILLDILAGHAFVSDHFTHCFIHDGIHCLRDAVISRGSDYCIDLRHLGQYFFTISLCQAARNYQSLAVTDILLLCHLKDGIYALLLGRSYEAAAVYNDDIRLALIIRELIRASLKDAHHILSINKILITAQRDKHYLHQFRSLSSSSLSSSSSSRPSSASIS